MSLLAFLFPQNQVKYLEILRADRQDARFHRDTHHTEYKRANAAIEVLEANRTEKSAAVRAWALTAQGQAMAQGEVMIEEAKKQTALLATLVEQGDRRAALLNNLAVMAAVRPRKARK